MNFNSTSGAGLGMVAPTRIHQRIIGRIHENIAASFPELKGNIIDGVAIMSDPEKVPDISLWRIVDDTDLLSEPQDPYMSIEITHTYSNDCYSNKSIRKTFECVPTLMESFIYNYEKDEWRRYSRSENGVEFEKGKDFSRTLGIYMHTLLK